MYTHPSYAINYYERKKNVNNDKLEMNRIPTVTQEKSNQIRRFSNCILYKRFFNSSFVIRDWESLRQVVNSFWKKIPKKPKVLPVLFTRDSYVRRITRN